MKIHKILYIEDNQDDLILFKHSFNASGFSPDLQVARDGVEALSYLNKLTDDRKDYPDLILLDLNLPGMSGYEFLKILKEDPLFALIPIIVFTGSPNLHDKLHCMELKAADYWSKPKDWEETKNIPLRLKQYLEHRIDQKDRYSLTLVPGNRHIRNRIFGNMGYSSQSHEYH